MCLTSDNNEHAENNHNFNSTFLNAENGYAEGVSYKDYAASGVGDEQNIYIFANGDAVCDFMWGNGTKEEYANGTTNGNSLISVWDTARENVIETAKNFWDFFTGGAGNKGEDHQIGLRNGNINQTPFS